MPCKTRSCKTKTNLNDDGYCKKCSNARTIAVDSKMTYPCGRCEQECTADNLAIQCELCETWNHIICVNIEETVYRSIMKIPGFSWFCCKCKGKVDDIIEKTAGIESQTKL